MTTTFPTSAELCQRAAARGWTRGKRLYYGTFEAVIIEHYYEDMWNVRVPGGPICVGGSDLTVEPRGEG